ncbi:hypothetical protein [Arcanobacterium canis]
MTTEEELIAEAESLGVTVDFHAQLPHGMRGAYLHRERRIMLAGGASCVQRLCTLAHELEHARRGHVGPQDRRTEALVNMAAARRLIDAGEYASAERVFDGNVVGIARELGVTPVLVAAYQEFLSSKVKAVA